MLRLSGTGGGGLASWRISNPGGDPRDLNAAGDPLGLGGDGGGWASWTMSKPGGGAGGSASGSEGGGWATWTTSKPGGGAGGRDGRDGGGVASDVGGGGITVYCAGRDDAAAEGNDE